jgi:hypothetical protein
MTECCIRKLVIGRAEVNTFDEDHDDGPEDDDDGVRMAEYAHEVIWCCIPTLTN